MHAIILALLDRRGHTGTHKGGCLIEKKRVIHGPSTNKQANKLLPSLISPVIIIIIIIIIIMTIIVVPEHEVERGRALSPDLGRIQDR